MDVFEFRDRLIEDYQRFSRSFTQIRAEDIRGAVEAAYQAVASGPLLSFR